MTKRWVPTRKLISLIPWRKREIDQLREIALRERTFVEARRSVRDSASSREKKKEIKTAIRTLARRTLHFAAAGDRVRWEETRVIRSRFRRYARTTEASPERERWALCFPNRPKRTIVWQTTRCAMARTATRCFRLWLGSHRYNIVRLADRSGR